MHRPMLVYRIPGLVIIDGIPVSDDERTKAELYFIEQQVERRFLILSSKNAQPLVTVSLADPSWISIL